MAAANPLMLERLLQPRLMLFWGAHTPTRTLLTALTALAAKNHPLRVFDGGNRFDGYFVARLARRFSHRSNGNGYCANHGGVNHGGVNHGGVNHGGVNHGGTNTINPSVGDAIDPHAVLSRIRLSRAFTCFQLAELIENTPPGADPLFVLDLLATFYDESVPLRDTERLLLTTISHLKRLSAFGPVIVGAREPRSLVKDRWLLLDHLQIAADSAWLMRLPETTEPIQPRLI
jgi:hypothetical protein